MIMHVHNYMYTVIYMNALVHTFVYIHVDMPKLTEILSSRLSLADSSSSHMIFGGPAPILGKSPL